MNNLSIPIYVKHNIQFRDGSNSRFEINLGPRPGLGKPVSIYSLK